MIVCTKYNQTLLVIFMQMHVATAIQGLSRNKGQFALLVLVNAFVGGMVGLERTIFPEYASQQFGLTSHSAMLSFIMAFGMSKAISNYYTGRLANRFGRRNLLIVGWILSLPVPLLLIYAPGWNWVVFANILLGIHQGLTWSSTVVMKIDLVGEKNRGLAMGLNEFAGYLAVGVAAYLTGYIATVYGVTPYPFYLGIFIAVTGLAITVFFVKDTTTYLVSEQKDSLAAMMGNVFAETTFRNKALSAVTQAGLVNNLNDGMVWGLLPVLLMTYGYDQLHIGQVTATYPVIWGLGQVFTGKMSDHVSKKKMLVTGMLLQAGAILLYPFFQGFGVLVALSVLLGAGTAIVYPVFLSAIAEASHPVQRAESLGTFRLWRDLGYAIGAVISGLVSDFFGLSAAFVLTAVFTALSSLILQMRMPTDQASH